MPLSRVDGILRGNERRRRGQSEAEADDEACDGNGAGRRLIRGPDQQGAPDHGSRAADRRCRPVAQLEAKETGEGTCERSSDDERAERQSGDHEHCHARLGVSPHGGDETEQQPTDQNRRQRLAPHDASAQQPQRQDGNAHPILDSQQHHEENCSAAEERCGGHRIPRPRARPL